MARRKGSLNKKVAKAPDTLQMTAQARIAYLANLIVDRIERDKKDGFPFLRKLEGK